MRGGGESRVESIGVRSIDRMMGERCEGAGLSVGDGGGIGGGARCGGIGGSKFWMECSSKLEGVQSLEIGGVRPFGIGGSERVGRGAIDQKASFLLFVSNVFRQVRFPKA
ncbi:hypothetical protein R1sor_007120 [Riccia sorocarpa]|uniref:Uncharacterized protein n=1 Tax=Riccia sorocarpa TaxID=122646 RepID=A0ABD3HVU6_9MARC